MRVPAPYRPTIWSLFAGCAAAVGGLALWVTLHPDIWGGHEFEGMIQTLFFGLLALASIPVVLIFTFIGMIRKDPVAIFAFITVAALAVYLFIASR